MVKSRERREERRRAGSKERDSKHRTGGDWNTLTIPEGIEVWRPEAGTFRFDVVPYKVGEGNPMCTEPGLWYYERTYYQHSFIGPNGETFICAKKTFGQPCAVCDRRAKLSRLDGHDEEIESLKWKERQLWLLNLHLKEGNKLVLFEYSYHGFGKLLDKLREDAEEDEDHVRDFDDWEAGALLKVSFSAEDIGRSKPFVKAYNIDFRPRPNGLDLELLEHGICLDELLKMPVYEEVAKALEGGDDDEDEDEDQPKPRTVGRKKAEPEDDDEEEAPKAEGKAKPKDEEDEDDWGDDEEEEVPKPKAKVKPESKPSGLKAGMEVRHRRLGMVTIKKVSGDGTSLTVEDEDGEVHRAIDPKDVKVVEAEEEEAPKPKGKRKVKPEPEEDEDDNDWGDDEEEEAPKPKVKGKAEGKAKPKDEEDEDDWD